MEADINYDGCADFFIRESLLGIMKNMHYHGIVRERLNMGYTDKYEPYPDLDYWWKGWFESI